MRSSNGEAEQEQQQQGSGSNDEGSCSSQWLALALVVVSIPLIEEAEPDCARQQHPPDYRQIWRVKHV